MMVVVSMFWTNWAAVACLDLFRRLSVFHLCADENELTNSFCWLHAVSAQTSQQALGPVL